MGLWYQKSSQVSCIECETRANKFNLTLSCSLKLLFLTHLRFLAASVKFVHNKLSFMI